MAVMVFYKSDSDHARSVIDYLYDFRRRTAKDLEEVDPDSRRGIDLAQLYGVVEYPTIIATTEDGQLRNMWRGLPLPTIDEVSYYV